ncbi:hypothetical protein L9F63_023067 [Diploptera punctata]|uniref:Neurotransmitter-gated ion-channel transmembrane domain-containing protein n=1 Tax=Diploptera punctata TaxID=6984 RepID=A0AAD7ZKU9_DIPPU|nr:hypothetical protein L9F63_023067 [Diploptera punctata]
MSWWYVRNELPVLFYKEKTDEMRIATHKAKLDICNDSTVTSYPWGKVSTVRVWLILKRELKAHMLDTYVPTTLFVIMSWGSFLVSPEMVPGRMVLLVTNLLSLVTMFEAIRASAPPSLGVKSIDVWLLSCIVFVFLALLEYAVILYRMKKTCRNNHVKRISKSGLSLNTYDRQGVLYRNSQSIKSQLRLVKRKMYEWFQRRILTTTMEWCILDRYSIICFPILFILYNIIYWSVYLSASRREMNEEEQCNIDL